MPSEDSMGEGVSPQSYYDDLIEYYENHLGKNYTIRRDGKQKEIRNLDLLHKVNGKHFFGGSGSSTPYALNEALADVARSGGFYGNRIYSISTVGPIAYVDEKLKNSIELNAFFVGGNVREAVRKRHARYRQANLGDIPRKFDNAEIPLYAAFVSVAPPRDGYFSLGLNNDVQTAALRNAEYIFVQVNENMPFTVGPGTLLPVSSVDYIMHQNTDIHDEVQGKPSDLSNIIAQNVMNYIEDERGGLDGRIYQFGIGGVPNAIAARLKDYHHLGVWSEMISDGVMELMQNGNIDNTTRLTLQGKTVTSFALGSKNFYEWLNGNEDVVFVPTDETNNRTRLETIDKYTSINSALEVSDNGEVGSNSQGSPHNIYSGVGGAEDTMRGARRAKDGVSVIALPSTAKQGTLSRIVPKITGNVAITNQNVDVLATEHGVVSVPHMHDLDLMSLAIVNFLPQPEFRGSLMDHLKNELDLCVKKPLITESDAQYRKQVRTVKEFDGKQIRFRALSPMDFDKLHDGFYMHGPKTIRKRYDGTIKMMPYCETLRRVFVDFSTSAAIGAFANNGQDLIGVGRLDDDERTGISEMALVVDDTYQKRGIGTYLCNELCKLAGTQGKTKVFGEVRYDNTEVRHIFEDADFERNESEGVEGWIYTKQITPKRLEEIVLPKETPHHNNLSSISNDHSQSQQAQSPLLSMFLTPLSIVSDFANRTLEQTSENAKAWQRWNDDYWSYIRGARETLLRGPRKSNLSSRNI